MINRLFSVAILLLAILPFSSGQNTSSGFDSCALLVYHSSMEAEGFANLCRSTTPDYLKMFLAVKPESDEKLYDQAREGIENEVINLKTKIAATKKPAKALKLIFTEVQKDFLKTYDVDAAFPEIFKTGRYNCLTATILYCLLLEKLQYKYTPKVMPGHVYLLVYAENKPYIFETTDPVNGFMEIDDEALRASIQSMRLFKYVQADNSDNAPSSNLFDRYYLQLNTTDLRGLLGYHYVNEMVLYSIKQEPDRSYELLKKALYITPQDELAIIREQLLRSLISEYSYRSAQRAKYVAEFLMISKSRNKAELVTNEFNETVNQCLFIGNPAPDSLNTIFQIYINNIKNTTVIVNVSESFYSFMSVYYEMNDKTDIAFDYAYKAYGIAPDNMKAKSLFFALLNDKVNDISGDLAGMTDIDSMIIKYPDIATSSIVNSKRCQIYLEIIRGHYENNRQALAEKYLSEFEAKFPPEETREYFCNPAMVYSIAASFYFRKGNNAKAKQVIMEGLEYSPGNYELESKLKQVR